MYTKGFKHGSHEPWSKLPVGGLRGANVGSFSERYQALYEGVVTLAHIEGPSTQYLRTLVPNTIKSMVFGTRNLKYWVLGPSEGCMLAVRCAKVAPGPAESIGRFQKTRGTHYGPQIVAPHPKDTQPMEAGAPYNPCDHIDSKPTLRQPQSPFKGAL